MNEREIFAAALHKSDAAERAAFLDAACAGDESLRNAVDALLAEHQRLGSFMDMSSSGATVDQEGVRPGTQIGPYKLLQQIGEGGMGVVYMAEQTEPVQRKVALKVIKPGMDSRQVIARFEAERQALAMMDHVNIARVLDAGATESGRPYFVMELVHGVPITKYCDDHHLTPRQRLELFVPVCQAIQHAHQKGIIHRDIKPSNVMVTLYDGKPVPKVIDFGVAKATEQKLTERTLFTQYGTLVGTLEYMSPEQAEVSALGVDTRSDIYSLGVLLYELLTGSTPLSSKRMKEAAYVEILRLIKEEEPPRPSTRLTDSGEALASISAQRQMEPAKLTKLVRGELDWIVMKTLEKDRNRRYETANGFAADVQRYLNDEPVQACPPSAAYRFRKFARRNKRALTTTVVLCVALLSGVGSLGWVVRDRAGRIAAVDHEATLAVHEANRHKEQRHWAEAISAAKRADSLLAGEGSEELRRSVRELRRDLEMVIRLERIRDEVMSGAKSQVEHKDESMFDVELADREYRRAFADYGIDIDALSVEEAAQRVTTRNVATELAAALDSWALARSSLGNGGNGWKGLLAVAKAADPDDWRGRLRDAWERKDLAALKSLSESEQVNRLPAHTHYLLGSVLREVGDVEGAVVFLRNAQQLHPNDFWINIQLALYYNWDIKPRKRDEVIRYATAANALRKQSAVPYRYLGSALSAKGNVDEAIAANKEAIRLKPNYWAAYYNLGLDLERKGQLDEAITAYREASRLYPNWSWPHAVLASNLSKKGSITEAEAEIREALRLNPNDELVLSRVGAALRNLKKLDEAIACYKKAIELHPKLADPHYNLGNALAAQGKVDEAISCFRKAIALDPNSAGAHNNLGNALKRKGMVDEAIACFRKTIMLDPNSAVPHFNLGNALLKQGQLDEAIEYYRKTIELNSKHAGAHSSLGNALFRQKRPDEAIIYLRKAVEIDPSDALDHISLGIVLQHQGKLDEAIACYRKAVGASRKAVELKPDDAATNNKLAWFLATCPDLKLRDPKEAVARASKAVALDPNNVTYPNTLGVALYQSAEWKAAIAALEKSMEMRKGGDSFDWFFLAMARWQLGEKDEASKWYDKAALWMEKNKPDDEELRRFRAEAEELLSIVPEP